MKSIIKIPTEIKLKQQNKVCNKIQYKAKTNLKMSFKIEEHFQLKEKSEQRF